MKKVCILIFLGTIIFCSCEKEKSAPANVHGTWIGNWTTDDSSLQGTYIAPANQNEDQIEGEVFIHMLIPSEEGYRPEYTGHVDENQVRVLFRTQGIDIQVTANIENTSEISGTFKAEDYFQGTFTGSKYPLVLSETQTIFVNEKSDNWYENMFIADDNFWIYNIGSGMFEVYNKSGEWIESRDAGFLESRPATFDGTCFWVYGISYENPGNNVYKVTSEGIVLDSIAMERKDIDGLYISNNTLYCTLFANQNIYTLDSEGNFTDSLKIDFLYPTTYLAYKEGFLVGASYSPYLFYINKQGTFMGGYQIDNNVYFLTQNQKGEIYCFTDEFVDEGGQTFDTYRIEKIELE